MISSSVWPLVVLGGVYLAIVTGALAFGRKRRKTRWPFKLEDRLLRGPGEHLRRRIIELDEQFVFEGLGGLALSFLAVAVTLDICLKLLHWTPIHAATSAVLASLLVMAGSAWRIYRLWKRRADHFLGWFGERVVAERLQAATLGGWRIFHDVPFVNNGAAFNIDHVAIGFGGVFVIETKTRRKGNARPGFKDHVVFFDGRDLVWPWGEDNHGLEQAERNAVWLTSWIKGEIGEKVNVAPMLALPGWWVERKPSKESRVCRVVHPNWIPGILAEERPVLSPKQVELIALRLEARCRDVED